MNTVALVSYSSSEDENDNELLQPEPFKKRKLPTLPASLAPFAPVDDPRLHQGRTRTTPHVEGQFAAHVYVALTIVKGSEFGKLVEEVVGYAGGVVPGLWGIGRGNDDEEMDGVELHISLSRPTYLRAHQREDFKRAVKAVARRSKTFTASFATFAELTNDEQTRTFLTMEVGAGHIEFTALAEALTPALQAIRQKEFYPDPRFHASIAWALCNNTLAPSAPHLPSSLLQTLNTDFSTQLARVGVFEVEKVWVKIGKEVVGWELGSLHPG